MMHERLERLVRRLAHRILYSKELALSYTDLKKKKILENATKIVHDVHVSIHHN
jgi:hypothetical protein